MLDDRERFGCLVVVRCADICAPSGVRVCVCVVT